MHLYTLKHLKTLRFLIFAVTKKNFETILNMFIRAKYSCIFKMARSRAL